MRTVRCPECGNEFKVGDKALAWSSWSRCDCGGKAVELMCTRQRAGDIWRGQASLSRAVLANQVQEMKALDAQRGVSNVVEWVPDGRGMAMPKFKSMMGRRKWDRAHKFYDADSYFG